MMKSKKTGTSEWFWMYSTRLGACPAGTFPKLKLLVLKVTHGPTALPLRFRDRRLPPAVKMEKFSEENVPVCFGA
jgi:hypothetical protein